MSALGLDTVTELARFPRDLTRRFGPTPVCAGAGCGAGGKSQSVCRRLSGANYRGGYAIETLARRW